MKSKQDEILNQMFQTRGISRSFDALYQTALEVVLLPGVDVFANEILEHLAEAHRIMLDAFNLRPPAFGLPDFDFPLTEDEWLLRMHGVQERCEPLRWIIKMVECMNGQSYFWRRENLKRFRQFALRAVLTWFKFSSDEKPRGPHGVAWAFGLSDAEFALMLERCFDSDGVPRWLDAELP